MQGWRRTAVRHRHQYLAVGEGKPQMACTPRAHGARHDRPVGIAHHRIAASEQRARIERGQQPRKPRQLGAIAAPSARQQRRTQRRAARHQPFAGDRNPVALAAIEPVGGVVEPLALGA